MNGRVIAMGDPQAPFSTVLAVLRTHGLLTKDDRLRDHVHLVSMGDHFDWGRRDDRAANADSSMQTLLWLAGHSSEQVTILLGNHDLARVGELASFDQVTFTQAQAESDAVYARGALDETAQAALLLKYPALPDAEMLARDYGCFVVTQREVVTELLLTKRFRLAAHVEGALLVHAGVTVADLEAIELDAHQTAEAIAPALNAFLDARVEAWAGTGPLNLEPFHRQGSASRGEGTGAMYHRPIDPSLLSEPLGNPPRRRFDPRELPMGLTQIIGHIRDNKCRELMPHWCEPGEARDGLRSLKVTGRMVEYRAGLQTGAQLIFVDAGMNHSPPAEYPLLDVASRRALERPNGRSWCEPRARLP